LLNGCEKPSLIEERSYGSTFSYKFTVFSNQK